MKGDDINMGVMDKFLNYMKLNGEDEEDEYYDEEYLDEEEDDEEPVPMPRRIPSSRVKDQDDYEEPSATAKRQTAPVNKITPIKQPSKRSSAGGMEVCVIKPSSIDDAREITETLLANRTVVLNLEGLDVDIEQRIVDFMCGSCYAISGNLQKISNYIFIVTPSSVDISGDFQDIFGESFEMPLNT